MARNRFTIQGKIGAGLDEDDVIDPLRTALTQQGEIFDFVPSEDGSCVFKAAPSEGTRGIKAEMRSRLKNGETHVSIEGKFTLVRVFWRFVHLFFVLVFLRHVVVGPSLVGQIRNGSQSIERHRPRALPQTSDKQMHLPMVSVQL